jgi:PAS domain S-box-containing protein
MVLTMRPAQDGFRTLMPRAWAMPAFILLVLAGLAGNYLRYEIFFNIQFIFGSIFALLALQLFGLGPGALAAALVSSVTWQLWDHPYAIVIMTAEVLAVGWLNRRRNVTFVFADALYWLCAGIPLVFLFYYGVMQLSLATASVTGVKQAINGIANALVARLIFIAVSSRSQRALFSLREIVLNLLALFVLAPSLTILAIGSRNDLRDTDRGIRERLIATSARTTHTLDTWLQGHLAQLDQLADLAAGNPPATVQRSLDRVLQSDRSFLRLGLVDASVTTVAFAPHLDESGRPGIGRSYADRPWVPLLKRTLKPMLSEVVMARFGPLKPSVTLLAPVIVDGGFAGYVGGVIDLNGISDLVSKAGASDGMLYTLLDRNGKVIVTNRPGLKGMDAFRREDGEMSPLSDGVAQWVSSRHRNVSIAERWKNSFYVKESPVGSISEWTLVLEQPVAPSQKLLYTRYAALASWVLALLLAALLLGELVTRRLVASLAQLAAISTDLPRKISDGFKLSWSGATVVETKRLFENLSETSVALEAKFNEVHEVNAALEEKVAERTRALQESEERYRQFFENNHTVMVLVDAESRGIVDSNPAASAFYGWTREQMRSKKITEINTLDPTELAVELSRANAQAPYRHDYQHRLADGSIRDVEVFTGPIRIDGKPHLFSIIHDATERRLAERQLAEVSRFNEQVLATLPVGVVSYDAAGRCVSCNRTGARLVGATPREVLAQNFRAIASWKKTGMLDAAERTLASGEDSRLQARVVTSFGRTIWMDCIFSRFSPSEEQQPHLLLVYADITDRQGAEERILRSLREKDVLLREIHHRVKNNMQVIYSLLNLQAQGIEDVAVRAMFEESRDRVNTMALIHEKLYRSGDLAHVDFKEYLQNLVEGVAGTYRRAEVAVAVEMADLVLDVNAGIPCGLIVNELVSNSFKHAFPAGRGGAIRVGMTRDADGGCVLTVADDGVGLPAGVDVRATPTLGLQLVNVLAGQLNGTVEVVQGRGTRFVVSFPGPPPAEEPHG